MRVLLDAHVSSRHIGGPLAASGHDVLALDRDEIRARLPDEGVLELAADEGRIVITHNVRHFAPMVRRWAEAGRSHAGCVLVTLPHTAYGEILRGLEQAFAARSAHDEWTDRTEFLTSG